MPNRKPKMHMQHPNLTLNWKEWRFGICNWEDARPAEQVADDWSKVTCGNCLRCRTKGERDA